MCEALGLVYNTVRYKFDENGIYTTKIDDKKIQIKRTSSYEILLNYSVDGKAYPLDSELAEL